MEPKEMERARKGSEARWVRSKGMGTDDLPKREDNRPAIISYNYLGILRHKC